MDKVVTRYAPSPTGSPHIGGVRTAIFAYLWAKKNKGDFLLRIEDTDRERLVPGAVKEIEDALNWLGLKFDGEIVYQSDRREVHRGFAEKLLSEGKAYKCFCTKERLENLRETQIKEKKAPGYDRNCRNLSADEVAQKVSEGMPYVIRLCVPLEGRAEWHDLVRGKMSMDYSLVDDQVLLKSDGWPTYFLASVVDDHEAGVTDVQRGEEWLPSTPKNIALYEAFGWKIPRFAHLPVILGKDGKKKLSKRDGDVSVEIYRNQGYLPEALINFLALLGWNPGSTQELFTLEELVQAFDVERIQKSPAIFDVEKLEWINKQYIHKASFSDLNKQISNILPDLELLKLPYFEKILEVEKSRLARLTDIAEGSGFYLAAPKVKRETLVFKKSSEKNTLIGLKGALDALEKINNDKWQKLAVEEFNAFLSTVVLDNKLSNGDVFWPVRVALTGLEKSASPAEILWVLGKDESEKRLAAALETLK